jgi:hypothetical protein
LLSDEVAGFLQSGISLLVATRDAAHRPECGRAVGLRVEADREHVTVFVSQATGQRLVRDLTDNGQIAVVASHVVTHRTLQLKGSTTSVRPATDVDRAFLDDYLERFSDLLELVGLPRSIVSRLNNWPATAATLRVREAYEQTPGPGAGAPFKGQWS